MQVDPDHIIDDLEAQLVKQKELRDRMRGADA